MSQIIYTDLPTNLLRSLHRPGQPIRRLDLGIDLIDPYEFKKVTQVKHYSKSTINWSDICKFLTFKSVMVPQADACLATLKESMISRHVRDYLFETKQLTHETVSWDCLLYTSPSPRDRS